MYFHWNSISTLLRKPVITFLCAALISVLACSEDLDSIPTYIQDDAGVADTSMVDMMDTSMVDMMDTSMVDMMDTSMVDMMDTSMVDMMDTSMVDMMDTSMVDMMDTSMVEMMDTSMVDMMMDELVCPSQLLNEVFIGSSTCTDTTDTGLDTIAISVLPGFIQITEGGSDIAPLGSYVDCRFEFPPVQVSFGGNNASILFTGSLNMDTINIIQAVVRNGVPDTCFYKGIRQ